MKRKEVCACCKGEGYVETLIDGEVDYDDCPFCDGYGEVDFDTMRKEFPEEVCEEYFELEVG